MANATATSTTEAMAELRERHARAEARVHELEREQYAAGVEVRRASDQLAHFERSGGRVADRAKHEATLAEARSKAAEPWSERVQGARAGARDAHAAKARFVGEHLDELVDEAQERGRAAAERFDDLIRAALAVHAEVAGIGSEISELVSNLGQVRPGDVSFSKADALVSEMHRFIGSGGERPPVLRRDPRQPRHGSTLPEAL